MEAVHLRPPSPAAVDFNYDSASTSPYATAPSSPQSTIPFVWEEKPGIPKQNDHNYSEQEDFDTDFAFGHLERHSISAADELFDCGKIKPLKPPPRLHFSNDSPKSPKSPKSRFKEALSPRSSKKKEFDPFSEALKQTSGEQDQDQNQNQNQNRHELQHRGGRERTAERITGRKGSRSLSPFRDSDLVTERKIETDHDRPSSSSSITWYSKWNLKNLLLFRSASEGNVTTRKDPLKKYTVLRKNNRDVKAFSFRSTESGGGGGGTTKVSADETAVETVAEEMRKKTTTTTSSHKSGLMGCLRFHQNGGSIHEISRGITSVIKQGN